MVASSPAMVQVANVRDGKDYGGYWTFIPLYKVTCGTYTESRGLARDAEECRKYRDLTTSIANTCIREPVADPNDRHLAVGITELIPVKMTKQGKWQGKASEHWTSEYSQAALPYDIDDGKDHDSVRWGFGEYQKQSRLFDKSGNPRQTAVPYAIDENSPLTGDCLEAASEFYTPLWKNMRTPHTEMWGRCQRDQTPISMLLGSTTDLKPCAIIGGYKTCKIQLMFEVADVHYDDVPGLVDWYTRQCSKKDGGGLWSFLSSFQMIFDQAMDKKSGRTAGTVEIYNNTVCQAWVAFVPSNGAQVRLKS